MSDIRSRILEDISEERDRQIEKFGKQLLTPPEFMSVLCEEVGEACTEANKCYWGHKSRYTALIDLRRELVQVAAVAVQIIERIDDTSILDIATETLKEIKD